MQVPKRRHSKSRVRQKRNAHYKRPLVKVLKSKDGSYKRPHIEEKIEL
jgi:ribosomal protein L32